MKVNDLVKNNAVMGVGVNNGLMVDEPLVELGGFVGKAWEATAPADAYERRVRDAEVRVAAERQVQHERLKAAEVLHAVWVYDEDEECRKLVDGSGKYGVYASGRARLSEDMLPVYGRDYAEVVCPDVADDPWAAIARFLPMVADEGRREGYRQAFEQLKYAGDDTADTYWGLYGRMVRDEVRGRYDAFKAKEAAVQASLAKMNRYAAGEDLQVAGEGEVLDAEALTEADVENVRQVADPKLLADAEAVRAFMRVYVKPLAAKEDAEEVLRALSQLEDELFECIGDDEQRAGLVYEALMDFAEGVKKSNKVGIDDEFVVAVGKKLQDWGRVMDMYGEEHAVAAAYMHQDFISDAYIEAMEAAQEATRRKYEQYQKHENARAALRAAIAKSLEVGDGESWWKGSLRAAAMMAGDTLPYLVPGVGAALGSTDAVVRGLTEGTDMYRLQGLTHEQAGGQAAIDAVVQAGVELLPFSRVGGKGLSAFVRSRFGAGLAKGKVGALSRWAVRQTQRGVGHALVAEWGAAVVDEAVLEPIAGGFLQYGAEHIFDVMGMEHGQTKELADCFEELKQVWEPRQLAGLAIFTLGLTGVSSPSIVKNVRYFAAHRNAWEAVGLKPGQVDKLMAIADVGERVEKGRKMVDDGWRDDPAGMAARMAKQNAAIKGRGEVLVMTGEGALDPELENSELAPAYRAVWGEYVEEGLLPKVEAQKDGQFRLVHKDGRELVMSAAHADAYLEHCVEQVEEKLLSEARTAAERAQGVDLRAEIGAAVSRIAGGAALRSVAKSEKSGIEVTDLVAGLPESLAKPILATGQVTLADAKAISEWALGQINALVEGGMSEGAARMSRYEADGMARSLGEWSSFARDFANRETMAGYKPGEGAISVSRSRGEKEVVFNGRKVMGQVIMGLKGRVSHYGAVEDIAESVTDMMLQERAAVLVEQGKASSLAEGERLALDELVDVVSRARAVVMKADPDADIEEVKPGDYMSVIEALSTMARAKFLSSGVVPKWMEALTSGLKGIVGTGLAVEKVRAAYAEVLRKAPNALAELEKVMADMGVYVEDAMREARIEAVDIQAWKSARAIVGARAAGPMGVGGAAVSEVVQEAERVEEEIVRAEGQREVLPVKSAAEVAAEAKERLGEMVPGSNAPAAMRGVFVEDKCYYNEAGGFWCGMIAKEKLSDGTEQVKVGAKGKHGVIQGKELTGNFQQNVGAIYVWKRKDGSLQVISGRHRFAKLMEDAGAKYCNCYVFEEDAEHDEKWARMLDYENNMRDDQADEVTAATYVRETGLPDVVLRERGLMRNDSRSKRGIFIGRHARQELWTRFVNGAVKPKDAQTICELTRSVKAEERIDEIQGKCCMLLDTGKSWEYIGGMVQLMASKEAQMKQGLLDFGADFMEDLARAAEWIEKCVHKVDAAIKMLRNGRKMSGEMREEALRLGVQTETDADSEEVLRDLQLLRKQFELIGSYPDLVAQAQMWDGKSDVDPVGYYLENARKERIEAQLEGEMTAEEYLAEQARKAAAESVPALFTMEMAPATVQEMSQRKLIDRLRAETGLSQFMNCVETVEDAKDRKDFNGQEYFFGELSDAVINEVQKVLPENISLHGAQHSLTTEDVWHMYRGHCLDSFITDDQISITFDDIRMIPDIVRNYDSVIAEKNSGKWSLVFLKQYGDVTYKYVTNISRKHDSSKIRHITLKTGWLIKSTGAEDDFTSRQSQTQGVSHFPRTVIITPMEAYIKQNYPDEARKIAKYAKEHDRTLHAPNGKISNLTPVQWLAVRLQSFKAWFGDWERVAELTFVSTGYDYKKGRVELDSKDSVLFNESLNLRVELNRAQKDKAFSPNARRKSMDNGFTSEQHCAVAAHLPNAFKHAMLLGEYNDADADVNIAKIMRLGAPVIVDGQKALAFMTVKVSYQKKKEMEKPAENVEVPRLYSLELDEIVRLGGQLKRLEHLQQNASSPSSEEIINDFNAKVKECFDNVSKIVDENGEPMVVYHGSSQWFHVFNDGSERHQSGAPDGTIFANDNREIAVSFVDYYGGKADDVVLDANDARHARTHWGIYRKGGIYALFMNLKNPLIVDFNGRTWHGEKYDIKDVNWYAEEARKGGYDGLIVHNVVDVGFTDTNDVPPSTDYVAFANNQVKSATDNRGTFDGSNADITFSLERNLAAVHSLSAEKVRFANAFHEVERAAAVEVKCAEVYVEDIKAARDVAMPIYDALRAEPVVMKDGRVVSFTRKGFKEVLRHAADRRVLASFSKMRELAGKAVYLGAAPNSQKNVLSKSAIKEFHYYLSKGNYSDFAAWREQRGDTTNVSGDAYVVIVVAEGENGAAFYDLDATDVEEVENNKGVSDILDAGRVPNPGRQDSNTPKGRIHRFKEYVNHIDAFNAEIAENAENNEPQETPVTFSMRTKEEPKKKGIGYKVFYQKDGKLYPPMVANPGGEDTPVGVWLDADEGVRAGESKTGRPQVKAGGKGTQGGSGTLAYRPGWHLGKIPYALQFNRKNPVTGERDLFPKDFVWAEVEYAADVDYQEEAMSYGVNKNGKFQHSLAGLPRIPEDGYYEYRTNPNPATDPWVITGAMKVKRVLTRAEVDELVRAAGRVPQKVEGDSKGSFSIIGPKAATWDRYKDRAFKGRDDGMLRAEIDASGARVKWEDLEGRNVAAYRRILAGWKEVPEADRKAVEAYAELCDDAADFARSLGDMTDDELEAAQVKLREFDDRMDEQRKAVREVLQRLLEAHGADGSVALTAEDDVVDAMAYDFWCEWGSDKVENALSSDPLEFGMELRDVLDFPELYEAYPQLEEVRVYSGDLKGYNGLAGNNGWSDYIKMDRKLLGDWERFRSVLLHEVQHVIQRIEGFARGGNVQSVRRVVQDTLDGLGSRMDALVRDLRWFSAVDIAREYLQEARRLRLYPNAWKRSGRRFRLSKLGQSPDELREEMLREIAREYEVFRRDDNGETLLMDMDDQLLPEVMFHSPEGIEAGLAALDKLKSRKLMFRGTAARKNRRVKEMQGRYDVMKKVLDEFGYEPYELYARLAGEIEARNVQARRDWTVDERLARPFNETLEYPGEALVTFSMVHVPLYHEILDTFEQRLSKDNKAVWVSRKSGNNMFRICSYPDVLNAITPWMDNVIANKDVIKKLLNKHHMLPQDVAKLPHALWDPIAVFEDPKAKNGGFIVVSDIMALNKEGVIKHVMVVLELKADKHNAVITDVKSAYSADKTDKYAALLKNGYLRYVDKERALMWASAEGDSILQLLTTALFHSGSGIILKENIPFVNTNFSGSMEKASLQALEMLRTRADEREGERLMNDWQKACEGWAQLHVGGDDSRLGNGAKMLGEIHALIGATKGVLPEKYARMGHLNGLLRWAAVYANMQQTGEVPAEGVIAGPIYEKFVERMRYIDKKNEAYGLNDAEVKEAMALLAGERLDVAMLKVARECKRRLEWFLKDRERERIDWVVERAYPKREKGKRTPRGKMDADTYRRMERAYRLMEMEANDVAGLMNRIKAALENMETAPADAVEVLRSVRGGDVPGVDEVEALEAELEDELFLAQTFGCWENMAFEQARRASGAMAELVLLGRSAWQSKLRAERRRAAYDRDEMGRHFGIKLEDVQAERGVKTAKEKGRKRTVAKKIAMGSMSYSQLLLALEPKLGKRFTGRHMRMIAEAHERIMLENQRRHRWMYNTLRDITGLESEGEIEEWMQRNNEVFDTGIDLELPMKSTCRLTPEEAKMWLSLTADEREKKREELMAEAAKKGEKPDNIPGEDVLGELEEKLMEAEQADAMPKEFVFTTEWSYKSRLKCTREALLYAILTFEQDDYEHLLEANGLTQAKLQQMRKLVGKELLSWGYAMRRELGEHGKMVAELYEAYTGVPFGQRQNYFRGVFDVARAKDAGEAVDQVAGVTGGKYGILIARQYHNQQLNWSTSASQVFVSTMKEQQNYIATAHIGREWRTLLSDRLFERRVRAEIGDAALDMINGWLTMIDGAVLADAKVNALMNRLLGRVMGAYAVSRLAGNVYTIMKQASALLNGFVGGYVPEHVMAGNELVQQLTYRHVGVGEYMVALGKAMAGQTDIAMEEIEAAVFIAGRKRVEGGHIEDAALLAPGQKVPGSVGRKARAVYEGNMDVIGYVDRKANAKAALALAEVVYQQAKKENADGLVPDAELRRVAIETARMMVDRAAQPTLRTQKGYWAAGGGMFGALGNFFYMFKSEVLGKMGLYVAQMFAGQHKAWIGGALGFGVMNSVILALIDWICGRWYDEDDEKWEKRAKQFAFNVVANDISSVPVVGDAVSDLRTTLLDEWSFRDSRMLDVVVPFGEMWKYGKREWKNIDKDASWDAHVTALCGFARSVGALGGWGLSGHNAAVGSCCELTLAAASLSNKVRFVKDVVKKVVGE